MKTSIGLFLAVTWIAPALIGCALYDEALLPSLTGEFRAGGPVAPELDGSILGMTDMAPRSAPIQIQDADAGTAPGPHLPLAIIRFTDPNLEFEGVLRAAIQHALSGKPDAGFGLVAISPSGTDGTMDAAAMQENIERVLAAMTKAGVAENQVVFSAASDTDVTENEVRVYLLDLTQSP